MPPRRPSSLEALGRGIDSALARRADGVLALCEDAATFAAPLARGPVRVIRPGLDARPSPAPDEIARTCRARGLEPGEFALYAGNLDGYQNLELLAQTALWLAQRSTEPGAEPLRIVIATHDREHAGVELEGVPDLECLEVGGVEELRALTFGARSLILPRRRRGGFPIKLLNYMEAARPIVAFEGVADGFEHGKNAWLLPATAGAPELAQALTTLHADAALAGELGRAGRSLLTSRHAWPELALRTRGLAEEVVGLRNLTRKPAG